MPRRRIHLRSPPQHTQHRHPGSVQRLPQQRLMPIGRNLVEDHPPDPNLRIPGSKPMHQRGNRPRLRRSVDNKNNRRPQQLRHMRRGRQLPFPRSPVEHPHHTLDDSEVTPASPMREQRPDQLRPAQIRVEVPPHPPGRERVIPGIDVVRPDLVRRHGKPPRGERGHQPRSNSGLATTGRRRGNNQPRNGGGQGSHDSVTTRYPADPSDRRPWGA
jgi:hypothetical protein